MRSAIASVWEGSARRSFGDRPLRAEARRPRLRTRRRSRPPPEHHVEFVRGASISTSTSQLLDRIVVEGARVASTCLVVRDHGAAQRRRRAGPTNFAASSVAELAATLDARRRTAASEIATMSPDVSRPSGSKPTRARPSAERAAPTGASRVVEPVELQRDNRRPPMLIARHLRSPLLPDHQAGLDRFHYAHRRHRRSGARRRRNARRLGGAPADAPPPAPTVVPFSSASLISARSSSAAGEGRQHLGAVAAAAHDPDIAADLDLAHRAAPAARARPSSRASASRALPALDRRPARRDAVRRGAPRHRTLPRRRRSGPRAPGRASPRSPRRRASRRGDASAAGTLRASARRAGRAPATIRSCGKRPHHVADDRHGVADLTGARSRDLAVADDDVVEPVEARVETEARKAVDRRAERTRGRGGRPPPVRGARRQRELEEELVGVEVDRARRRSGGG